MAGDLHREAQELEAEMHKNLKLQISKPKQENSETQQEKYKFRQERGELQIQKILLKSICKGNNYRDCIPKEYGNPCLCKELCARGSSTWYCPSDHYR